MERIIRITLLIAIVSMVALLVVPAQGPAEEGLSKAVFGVA